MRPVAAAIQERTDADGNQHEHLDRGQERRDSTAEGNCRAVDDYRQGDGGEGDELQSSERNIDVRDGKESLI